MTLWFIQCDDAGENFDLFVKTNGSRADAVEAWINYYEMDTVPKHRVMNLSDAALDDNGVLQWDFVESPI